MSISPVLYSSASGVWATPRAFFDRLDAEFGFTLDAAANAENHLCADWYGPGSPFGLDGLAQDWSAHTAVWVNPPYGRAIGAWVRKATHAAMHGATVVMLVPARTDTLWWHDDAIMATEIRFVRGRIRFGGAAAAPFPSAVLVYRPSRLTPAPRVTWDTAA